MRCCLLHPQTCLATVAIDRMAQFLMPGGRFSLPLLRSVNDDAGFMAEFLAAEQQQQAAAAAASS